ncbi:MAG: glutamate-5-semialdehyde dehydrogenase [Candidatus Pelagibacter sp. TMED196]|nr:MAG: glutamate-5-semialdehyde dehydrogenase [Candidatus Pelagibacter sp. TMED196]
MKKYLQKLGKESKKATLKKIDTKTKNKVLLKFSYLLKKNSNKVLRQNKKDIKFAKLKNINKNLIARLEVNKSKLSSIIKTIIDITKLKDPVGVILDRWQRPNGLKIEKISIPIGVIAVIYESRPNVTVDLSCLCFKSGNSVILKGGSEAFFTNKIFIKLFREALKAYKINMNYVQFVERKERKIVNHLLKDMKSYIDVMIPRGGKNLVQTVKKLCNVPVIGHLEGICHTFIDKNIDIKMARNVVVNAKMRSVGICGATETLLIHKDCPKKKINLIINDLKNNGCLIYADKKVRKIFSGNLKKATNKDWNKEYLDAKISVKIVKNVVEAVQHINKFGTMHTDSIITNNITNADYFTRNVTSSIAMHNTSTQFADGGELGFGGEVGISTNKLPPRGPVGLNQLVSFKYHVAGNGQIRK